jgi:hypothetical protein
MKGLPLGSSANHGFRFFYIFYKGKPSCRQRKIFQVLVFEQLFLLPGGGRSGG